MSSKGNREGCGQPRCAPFIPAACIPLIGAPARMPAPRSRPAQFCERCLRPRASCGLAPPLFCTCEHPTDPDHAAEDGGLPLRSVTDFEVVAAGSGNGVDSLRPLDVLGPAAIGQLVLTGQLVPAAQEAGGTADGARHPVTTYPLLDWVVDYGAAEPALWAVTQHAWYRLLQPSARYAQLFAGVQRKAALAHAAAADGSAAANPEGAVERAAVAMQASGDQAAKEFALAQLQASASSGATCTQFLQETWSSSCSQLEAMPLFPLPPLSTGLQAKLGLRPRAGGKRVADGPRSRPAKKQRVGDRAVLQPGWECSHAYVPPLLRHATSIS